MTSQPDATRVLIADEQSLFREAVKVVLETQPDISVVAEAADGRRAIAEAARTRPDVALVDVGLPDCDSMEATSAIVDRVPGCRVVILAPQESQKALADALEAGASGYLTKDCPLAHLIHAVRSVHQGETLVPPRMLGPLLAQLIRRQREQGHALQRMSRLTRREREVLALLADGADNGGIARILFISPQTARTHIQNVLTKLGVHSRLEAASFVLQNGILPNLVGSEG
ncbi:response regulator transcription factor [soil metagenome]